LVQTFPDEARYRRRLVESAELLGPDIHIQSDYGSEASWRTPWELFGEADAKQSLTIAQQALAQLEQIEIALTSEDPSEEIETE